VCGRYSLHYRLLGFAISTASALYAIWIIVYVESGGFDTTFGHHTFHYDFLYRCVARGMFLSLIGMVFALSGSVRRGPVRWHAPAGSLGTLAFWLLTANWL